VSMQCCTVDTYSQEETELLGRRLAALLPAGSVVALRGELATGKTCFVRGMAGHFGPDDLVRSPSFTLVNEYGDETKLYHLDLYRLNGPEELLDIGYEELFEPDGITVIEWAERAEPLLPKKRLDITLEHAGQDHRRLTFADHGLMSDGSLEQMADALGHA